MSAQYTSRWPTGNHIDHFNGLSASREPIRARNAFGLHSLNSMGIRKLCLMRSPSWSTRYQRPRFLTPLLLIPLQVHSKSPPSLPLSTPLLLPIRHLSPYPIPYPSPIPGGSPLESPGRLHWRYCAFRRPNLQRLPGGHYLGGCLSRSCFDDTTLIGRRSCEQPLNGTHDRLGPKAGCLH